MRLREADGTVREDAYARGLRSWRSWSASRGKIWPLGSRTWQEMGPRNIAGRVISVAIDPADPDVIWAGSAGGGFWKSADFGQTWTQMGGDRLPSLWIGAIAVDPRDSRVLYLGTGEANDNLYGYGGYGGLLKTTDGGRSFTRIPLDETAFYKTLVSPADSRLVLTAGRSGLWRSTDAGGRFDRVLEGKITDFAQDPKNASRLLATRAVSGLGEEGGLFESLDSGATWRPFGTGLPGTGLWKRGAVAFAPAPATTVYLAMDTYSELGAVLYRSQDDGRTWAFTATHGRQGYAGMTFYGAHLAAPTSGAVFQANGISILVSRDGGLTWTRSGGDWHSDTHGIAVDPHDSRRIVLATDGGVAVSTDNGFTFRRADHGFPTVQLYTCAIGLRDSSTLFGGTQDNWMNAYRGAAEGAWDYSYPPARGDITAISVNPAQPDELLAVTAEALGVGLSRDQGGTWTSTRGALPVGGAFPWVARLARSPVEPRRVYMGQGRFLAASLDGGASWQVSTARPALDADPALAIADIAASPTYEREVWTIWTDGKVLVSGDGGLTWEDRSPPAASRAGIRVSAGPLAGSAYALLSGTTGARLFRTRDDGLSWEDISAGLPQLVLNAVLPDPHTPGRLLVATDAGVALSTDDGETWQDASGDLPNAVVFDLCQDPASGRLAAATYGRGLWELKAAPPCAPDASTLCLNGNRFEVKATWETPDGQSGVAHAMPLTADTGYFWFFDAANAEMIVKVLEGCGVNGSYWVYAGGLTNVRTTLTVTDTVTHGVKTYVNPQKTPFQPIQDTGAFPVCR